MNFWKQTTHVMSYFKEENFRGDKRLPSSFMTGFLEVSTAVDSCAQCLTLYPRAGIKASIFAALTMYIPLFIDLDSQEEKARNQP